MKFTLYSIWIDYSFYVYVIIFIAAVTALLFAVRKLMDMSSAEEDGMPEDMITGTMAAPEEGAELPQEQPEQAAEPQAQPEPQELFEGEQQAAPEQQEQPYEEAGPSPAEEFLKNLYGALSNIDERMKNIEKNIAAPKPKTAGNEFILKFLEDIMNDYDSLDKEKVKARIQFLISDLKK